MKYLIIVFFIDVLFIFSSMYELLMLQMHKYNRKHHFYLFIQDDIKYNYPLYLLKYLLALSLLFMEKITIYNYISVLVFIIALSILSYNKYMKYKHNIAFTKRLFRVLIIDYLVIIVFQLIFAKLSLWAFTSLLLVLICFNPYILILICYLLWPYERYNLAHYKKIAINKLKENPNLKIITISGRSYAPVKELLNNMLALELKGTMNRENNENINGILKTINDSNTNLKDYLILGVDFDEDINDIINFLKPNYHIIVNEEDYNIIKNNKTVFVINKDDIKDKDLSKKKNLINVSTKYKTDFKAGSIIESKSLTKFEITDKKAKKPLKVNTKLIGRRNIYNILLATAVANKMGISNKNITKVIKETSNITNNLDIQKSGIHQIIDNIKNTSDYVTLDALKILEKQKDRNVIITSSDSYEDDLLKKITKTCDIIILLGQKQTKKLRDRIIRLGFKEGNIIVANEFEKVFKNIIKSKEKTNILLERIEPIEFIN